MPAAYISQLEAHMKFDKRLSVGVIVAVLALLGGALLGGTADAAKKKSKVFKSTKTVNQGIPNFTPGGLDGVLRSTITVPKKSFKGKTADVVQVTGLQTTGSGPGAAADIEAFLSSPQGRTIELFENIGDVSIGPLTLTPNSPVKLCDTPTPPCADVLKTLNRPFAGTAGDEALAHFTGVKMTGTWTLTVEDDGGPATTSILNQWGLSIKPQKPVV
jgi:hypothetical protein